MDDVLRILSPFDFLLLKAGNVKNKGQPLKGKNDYESKINVRNRSAQDESISAEAFLVQFERLHEQVRSGEWLAFMYACIVSHICFGLAFE